MSIVIHEHLDRDRERDSPHTSRRRTGAREFRIEPGEPLGRTDVMPLARMHLIARAAGFVGATQERHEPECAGPASPDS